MIPNAYFILLNRDVWDNAFRMFLFNYSKGDHDYAYRLSTIMQQFQLWRAAVDSWSKAKPERCLAIGYEELVADPTSALAEICGFCNLSMPELPPRPTYDDRGCAEPYREMMEACLKDEEL